MASQAAGSPKLPENSVANTIKNVQPVGNRTIGPVHGKGPESGSSMVPKVDPRVSGRKTI